MTQLIALTGPAGSGKSFCADIFVNAHGFQRIKFAAPLKEMIGVALRHACVPEAEIEDYIEGSQKDLPCHAFAGRSPRHAMQTLGGEWGRGQIDQNFWINLARIKAMRIRSLGIPVVIDDCRYPNEAEAVREMGGKVIRIAGRQGTIPISAHASEALMPTHLVDGALNNAGNSILTHREVRRIIQQTPEGTQT